MDPNPTGIARPDGPLEEPERWALRPVRTRDKLLGAAIGASLALLVLVAIWVIQGPAAFTVLGPR